MSFRGQTRSNESRTTGGGGPRDQGSVGKRTAVESVQRKQSQPGVTPGPAPGDVAARGTQGATEALPHREKIQAAFGPTHDVSGILASTGGAAAEACDELGAKAYASGGQVGFKFDSYARTQADWATGPAIGADKDKLWALLEKARGEEAFLAGCGPMTVAGLLPVMADAKRRGALEHYCAAVHKDRATVEIEPTVDLGEAIKMGDALPALEATPGGVTIKTIMKQQSGKTQLQDMIADKAIDPFTRYVQASHPVLMANNGAEIDSYLAMKAEGVDPVSYKTKVPRIRNLHRFEKAALDALAINEGDTAPSRRPRPRIPTSTPTATARTTHTSSR